MKIRIGLLVLVICMFTNGLYSQKTTQTTKGKKIEVIPFDYQAPTGAPATDERKLQVSPGNLWVAYSQMDNNPTSMVPNDQKPYKKMNYMEAFWVIGVKGNWLELAKWELLSKNEYDLKTGELKKELEYYGWVDRDKMLAWRHCLVDPDNHFAIKALTANNSECMKNPYSCASGATGKVLHLFNDPGLTKESKNDVRLFDFLYIYKQIGNAVLVGKNDELMTYESKLAPKKILGWIAASVVKQWKQRLVLEPNWDESAVAERKEKKVKTSIFYTPESTKKFMDDPANTEEYKSAVMWEKDPYAKTQWDPYTKRLPLLDTKINDLENAVIKTGIVTKISNQDGEVFDDKQASELRRQSEAQRANFRKVNIIFMVDGSHYMKSYKTNILHTISEFATKLRENADAAAAEDEQGGSNTYKIGAVIYRGTQDTKCSGEDLSVQAQELTSNYNEVIDFLNTKLEKTGCNDAERTRAYYKGLKQALRQFGVSECKRQSNIIIVIGGSANSNEPAFESQKKEVQMGLIDYQVGILGFQIFATNERYNTDFLLQTRNFILTTAKSLQDSTAKLTDKQFAPIAPTNTKNLFRLKCPENSPVPGEVVFTDESAPMNPDTLESNILALIKETTDSKEAILDGIDSKLNGLGLKVPINEGMMLFLKNMNVDEALLRKTSYQNVQLYVDGYTAYKPAGFTNPLYKVCVFMKEGELVTLLENLKKIESTNTSSNDLRNKMLDGFRKIVESYFGPREAAKALKSKSGEELMMMLTGLPTNNATLKKFHLDQITNKRVVPDGELNNLASELEGKISSLSQYSQDDTHFFKNQDNRYIWVPADYFP